MLRPDKNEQIVMKQTGDRILVNAFDTYTFDDYVADSR
jgi:hypothetical protein